MDKVELIRKEIEKRLKGERFLSSDKEYNYLLSFIDSLQEEPSIPEIVDEHYWEMLGEEPVSDDLEEAYEKYADERLKIIRPDIYDSSYSRSTKMTFDLFEGYELETAFEEGANWQKEQMMKDATEAVVAIDSGGYPYIDKTIELYDYDKDEPLAKKGDKYKVILIKED